MPTRLLRPLVLLAVVTTLGGTGHAYAAFTWQNSLASTPGLVNANQTFQ